MRILVTGATGFLGTALCDQLRRDGHQVTGLGSRDADLKRAGALDAFDNQAFDQIYHLATWTQAGDFCLRHPGEQWVINQQINTNVLAWWSARQPQAKLLAMGASCGYAPGLELVESNYLEGQPIDSLYSYAWTKRMLYIGLQSLQRQYGLRYVCLVPATLYGPGYHTDGRQMHFIFDLIRKIIRSRHDGEPVVLWGDGYQKRELLFVEDFARLAPELMGVGNDELLNVGTGQEHSIRQYAELICAQVGYDPNLIRYDTTRYVGATSKCLNVDKFRRIIPAPSLTPLESGLRRTIDWFMQLETSGAPAA